MAANQSVIVMAGLIDVARYQVRAQAREIEEMRAALLWLLLVLHKAEEAK